MTKDIIAAAKTILKSRRPSAKGSDKGERSIVVMGNGPSLRKVLDEQRDTLSHHDLMAVNFAANSPEFHEIKPSYYILADPHFFNGTEKDTNVARLWENLGKTTWDMVLFVPASLPRMESDVLSHLPGNVSIKRFNLTPTDGSGPLSRFLIDKGLATPRPRNVLIPAIMAAMREGYRRIAIVGADHSWLQSLWVDDKNRVVSVQPHFYKDNEKELDRVAAEYAGYHLHDILGSMTIAFRSYHQIADYARRNGIEIINATPGSYIDAFPRGSL